MLLDAPTAGPTTANIRRVFGREDAWYFTTSREIYSYGLQGHRWHRYYLDFGYQELPEIADIVLLEPGDPGESVTVTTSDGRFFVGTLSPKNGRIPLVEMTLPPPDRFDATAEDLLDVQDRGDGYWTFLLQDRIKRFDPRARRWLEDERLPGTDATYRYGTAAGLPMLTARDPGTGAEQWWLGRPSWRNGEALIPFEPNPDSTVTTAIASNGDIWELHKDQGLLRRCHVQQAHEPQRYECKVWETAIEIEPETISIGLIRLARAAEDTLAATKHGLVAAMAMDDGGSLWIRRRAGDWQVWQKDRFALPPALAQDESLGILAVNEGLVTVAAGTEATAG